jgi:hypothetical protein
LAKATWGETVRVGKEAPASLRPGTLAEVVGIREVETPEQVHQFGAPVGTKVYLVELGNGDALEVPEGWLESVVVPQENAMESVIIIAPFAYDDELRNRLSASFRVSEGGFGGWVVEVDDARVYVSRNDLVAAELEQEELDQITQRIPSPVFYSVDFSDIDLCRRVLMSLADDPDLLVDNDHGLLLVGSELVRLLRSRPEWDWRKDSPEKVLD